jgi:predicted 3-demethylubiquinone-9 3-methyltransferase (glyoxalase superfamily)
MFFTSHPVKKQNNLYALFPASISFMVCNDAQEEIDYYLEKLSAVPEAEQRAWLKDKLGIVADCALQHGRNDAKRHKGANCAFDRGIPQNEKV